MVTNLLNRLIGLFISEQDEKADMDTKVKSLLLNIASLSFTLIVLAEGIWALVLDHAELAIPFLSLSFLLAISHLYLRKFTGLIHQNLLLSILFLACVFFVLLGGNTELGIVWVLFFPFFTTAIRGRRTGYRWTAILALFMLAHFFFIQNLSPFFQQYSTESSIFYLILFVFSIIIAFAFQFIRSEVLLEKERIILDSQNKNKAQEDLLSKLSHQIRTPLSNITGIIDMLESTSMNNEQKDYINTIHASANNLVSVVNNLVLTSKSNPSDSQEITNFSLYNTLNNVLRLFPYEESKVRFNLSLAPDIPTQLTGNNIKIKQILLNLINSIIRENKAEQKHITLEVVKVDSMPDRVELIFRIISDFIYSSKKDNHSEEGFFNYQDLVKLNAGKIINYLDLGITQKMIEVDGHSLNITPQPDQTIFEFGATFSTASSNFANIVASDKSRNSNTTFKPIVDMKDAHILLVEDNFSNQQIINLYIRNKVKKIDFAFNGKEALEKFGMAKYDLILMDVQMPIIDGFKATIKIRELEKSTNTRVPIIAVTANAFPEDKERCLASGMDDYISKPFQPEELIDKIKQHLSS
ncbi:response regulator [Alkalitalea saponilacus]|uniref:histidine kinase n=1 Tax=Alkalitalea saponilacus TaxID=889453 RepID=A0A1T5HQ97_9BACT|nr:response regulator [Alkalitalea saponilacus]ASB48448.1 histidine kinase [Alkalitalea saponilacus]SKC22874.1 His Kinase A (phospho-acceptor) domain-containing protein [Alkalitalea saponilacus]